MYDDSPIVDAMGRGWKQANTNMRDDGCKNELVIKCTRAPTMPIAFIIICYIDTTRIDSWTLI